VVHLLEVQWCVVAGSMEHGRQHSKHSRVTLNRASHPGPKSERDPSEGRADPSTTQTWWSSLAYLVFSGTPCHVWKFQEVHLLERRSPSRSRNPRCPSVSAPASVTGGPCSVTYVLMLPLVWGVRQRSVDPGCQGAVHGFIASKVLPS